MSDASHADRPVTRADGGTGTDAVAVEEPLEIHIGYGPTEARLRAGLGTTLRTPGHDHELAAGFLLSEGVIQSRDGIVGVTPAPDGSSIRVGLRPDLPFDPARFARRTLRSSACGACGRIDLDRMLDAHPGPPLGGSLAARLIPELPARLLAHQAAFRATGGTHAAGLFTLTGELLSVREDVGRHNALDKLIGAELLADRVPLADRVVVVSSRAGFELVQKCAAAGLPILVAVGAPTTLAVDLANETGVTLIGFTRAGRFTIYSHAERVAFSERGDELIR